MEHSTVGTPPLVAAPRHLRRRRFATDIPDLLLAPGAEPCPEPAPSTEPSPSVKRAAVAAPPAAAAYRRKRLVAFLLVLAVAVSVPVLIAALILAG